MFEISDIRHSEMHRQTDQLTVSDSRVAFKTINECAL